jgi:hypothetical protein
LNHQIEFTLVKHGHRVHGCFHGSDIQSAGSRHLAVDAKHLGADVYDGDNGASRRVQDTVPASASSQAQYAATAEFAVQPNREICDSACIGQFMIIQRLGEPLPAADPRVPSATVVLVFR